MVDEKIEVLFEAHQLVGEEIGQAKARGAENEFTDGHINGLEEAENRIEEVIYRVIEEKQPL